VARWRGGERGEEALLRRCYQSVLAVAREHQLTSVAFPSISTGAFAYPVAPAARVAMEELLLGLRESPHLKLTVVCFEAAVLRAYQKLEI
jgi:O-acetyl-ADP-ribose deacetylase